MMPRRARSISVLRESLAAAAVLFVGVPPILGVFVFMMKTMSGVTGQGAPSSLSTLEWLGIWAGLTAAVLLLSMGFVVLRLRAGRHQPHHSEYRDFRFMRHVRHGPLSDPKRTQVGGFEVLSFGLQYFLSAKPVPAWWPVMSGADAVDLVVYAHRVFLCVLPNRPPPVVAWSKSHRWGGPKAEKIIGTDPRRATDWLSDNFDVDDRASVEALVRDSGLERLLLANTQWSFEVRGDRLLVYRLPPQRYSGDAATDDAIVEREGIQFVAELADQFGRMSNWQDDRSGMGAGFDAKGLFRRIFGRGARLRDMPAT